jgi:hypothetical protein
MEDCDLERLENLGRPETFAEDMQMLYDTLILPFFLDPVPPAPAHAAAPCSPMAEDRPQEVVSLPLSDSEGRELIDLTHSDDDAGDVIDLTFSDDEEDGQPAAAGRVRKLERLQRLLEFGSPGVRMPVAVPEP